MYLESLNILSELLIIVQTVLMDKKHTCRFAKRNNWISFSAILCK